MQPQAIQAGSVEKFINMKKLLQMLDILWIPPMTCDTVRDRKARCNATMAAEWLDCVSHMEQEQKQDRKWNIEQIIWC